MKKVFLMTLMAIAMIACNKEDDSIVNGDVKTVKLNIKAGALSRAVEQPLGNNATTSIHSLYVYFLDAASGNVVSGSKAITGIDLTAIQGAGLEITGVSASARYVYVVANYAENSVDLSGITNLASIKAKTATMTTANTADWDKALLSNSDKSDNGKIGIVTNNKASATVEVMPDLSRLEISSLVARTVGIIAPDVAVTEYDLKGVYLNGYFSGFHVGGVADGSAATLVTSGAGLSGVALWAKDVYAPTSLAGKTTYTASSTPGEVWAYMIPAGATPRIIFDIDNVKYGTDEPATQDKFITVKSFRDSGTNDLITEFLRGKVYKVSAVNFSAKDAHDTPNAEDIDVTVKVTVLNWVGIDINPEL